MDDLVKIASIPISDLYKQFQTRPSGLSEKEVKQKIKQFGFNKLVAKDKFRILKMLWSSFFSPLVLLLLAASLISSILGDIKDFIIIFGIVVLSGGITFYQHFKADNAAEKLKKAVQLTATVVRDGLRKEIPFSHVVPGDIIILSAGDIIPADGRIISSKDLTVDESTLTGESFPAEKTLNLPKKALYTLSSLTTLVFAGTHVNTGEATVLITETGITTQLGKLSKEIIKPKPKTDFDTGIENLSITMIKIILLLSLFVFGVNALLHNEIITSFTFAVALAVGLTPELMPVILTINLSRGAMRMEKKQVIVKYLPAIQNFGSMDILCTDKTGTLTENEIALIEHQNISGESTDSVLLFGILDSTLKSGVKDPLDQAILRHPHNFSLDEYSKLDELPFDFKRKRASVVVQKGNHTLLITKGAPQKILPLCERYETAKSTKPLSEIMRKHIESKVESLNKKGLRVLLIASKKIIKKEEYEVADENSLTYHGMLIFQDTVKATVGATIKDLKHLGISVKILTGDNEFVTEKICSDVNLQSLGTLTEEQIDNMNMQELDKAVEENTIFARLTPEQKERIILSLKRNGHVVGYLGDGVNDAPPLKAADVGISVHNGSDIARDVADIVLMRKSLTILQEGVLEGRKTHANIMKYIMMSLSSNFGNMASVAVASVFIPFLPLLPTQVLLINFLYDLAQITIPTDNVDVELIKKPQQWNLGFIKNFMLEFGPISSIFDISTFVGLFILFHASIPLFRTGWFIESVVTQTLIVFAIRTRRIPFFKSMPSPQVIVSAVFSLGLAYIFVNNFSSQFSFSRIPATFYIFLITIILAYFFVVEIGKVIFFRFFVKS